MRLYGIFLSALCIAYNFPADAELIGADPNRPDMPFALLELSLDKWPSDELPENKPTVRVKRQWMRSLDNQEGWIFNPDTTMAVGDVREIFFQFILSVGPVKNLSFVETRNTLYDYLFYFKGDEEQDFFWRHQRPAPSQDGDGIRYYKGDGPPGIVRVCLVMENESGENIYVSDTMDIEKYIKHYCIIDVVRQRVNEYKVRFVFQAVKQLYGQHKIYPRLTFLGVDDEGNHEWYQNSYAENEKYKLSIVNPFDIDIVPISRRVNYSEVASQELNIRANTTAIGRYELKSPDETVTGELAGKAGGSSSPPVQNIILKRSQEVCSQTKQERITFGPYEIELQVPLRDRLKDDSDVSQSPGGVFIQSETVDAIAVPVGDACRPDEVRNLTTCKCEKPPELWSGKWVMACPTCQIPDERLLYIRVNSKGEIGGDYVWEKSGEWRGVLENGSVYNAGKSLQIQYFNNKSGHGQLTLVLDPENRSFTGTYSGMGAAGTSAVATGSVSGRKIED